MKKKDLLNPVLNKLYVKTQKPQISQNKYDQATQNNDPVRDNNSFFLEAMSNVTPLSDKRVKITQGLGSNKRPAHKIVDDEKETMHRLAGLIEGNEEMNITFSDEYIEGSVKGFSRKLVTRLKKGEFSIQDYIDLHGLTRKDAEIKVKNFIVQSRAHGLRCVLIVHGRGLNSPDNFSVLKENIPIWLSRGPARKGVLAFTTARPYDGGTGAVYVLLRKK